MCIPLDGIQTAHRRPLYSIKLFKSSITFETHEIAQRHSFGMGSQDIQGSGLISIAPGGQSQARHWLAFMNPSAMQNSSLNYQFVYGNAMSASSLR